MIILDTNILSALMQKRPSREVIDWLDQQSAESIWITSITVFEIRYGLSLLEPGQRRVALEQRFSDIVTTDLANRVLVFDVRSSDQAARLAAERKARGRPVDMRDTFIAGIALAHRAALATRNVAHFQDLPIQVIDPWRAADDPISRPSGSR